MTEEEGERGKHQPSAQMDERVRVCALVRERGGEALVVAVYTRTRSPRQLAR